MQVPVFNPGQVVDNRFLLGQEIGRGGMSSVFSALDQTTGRQVALKQLLKTATDSLAAGRFLREAQVLATLRHPGIVAYIAHGVFAGQPYLAMEWLEGQELALRLSHGLLGAADVVRLLRHVAGALVIAHRVHVVHRDIKPSNLFLRNGQLDGVTLIDFGIAHRVASAAPLTQTGMIVGTPEYMAPEQVRARGDISPAADVFSLGCVLYRCLAGRSPFFDPDIAALLTKILFDEPTPLEQLCPGLPADLVALIARMLAKSAAGRPPDAQALLTEVAALKEIAADAPPELPRQLPGPEKVTSEQALFCVVVALRSPLPGLAETRDDVAGTADGELPFGAINHELAGLGIQVEWLLDASLVAAIPPSGVATDQAVRAARCALLINKHWPASWVVAATGRAPRGAARELGAVVSGALRLLRETVPGLLAAGGSHIVLDDTTANLLGSRFAVTLVGPGVYTLAGPPIYSATDGLQSLLKRSPVLVGRERELSSLLSYYQGCKDESRAWWGLLLGAAGLGKSRLLAEFLRTLHSRDEPVLVLQGRGEELSQRRPYGPLSDMLRRLGGMERGAAGTEPALLLQRLAQSLNAQESGPVLEFLCELCGVALTQPASALLRSAHKDPLLMQAQLSTALIRFLEAECRSGPVVLLLDDLHWADDATLKLLGQVVRALADQPLWILMAARPELTSRTAGLWRQQTQHKIHLRGLTQRAAERLCKSALRMSAEDPVVVRIMAQADGNPLLLEELIRAVAAGGGDELPQTVLAILQARLASLADPLRHTLCLASVFGDVLWSGGVQALLAGQTPAGSTRPGADPIAGNDPSPEPLIASACTALVEAELLFVEPTSRFGGQLQLRFRNDLVRRAAYELLTKQEAQRSHLQALEFLLAVGETEPNLLAWHAELGGAPERAAALYLSAAERSFDNYDLSAAILGGERALACGARDTVRGGVMALLAWCHVHLGQLALVRPCAEEALALLQAGSPRWYRALGALIVPSSMEPPPTALRQLAETLDVVRPEPAAIADFIQAASVLTLLLAQAGLAGPAHQTLASAQHYLDSQQELRPWAWVAYARSAVCGIFQPDPWAALQAGTQSVRDFDRAGDLRNQIFAQTDTAMLHAELGDAATAQDLLRRALQQANGLGDPLAMSYVESHLARFLSGQPDQELLMEALTLINRVRFRPTVAPIFRGMAAETTARVCLAHGDASSAARSALGARQLHHGRPIKALSAGGLLLAIRLCQGADREAGDLATELLGQLDELQLEGPLEVPLRRLAADALLAAGDAQTALIQHAQADRQEQLIAEKIPDPPARARYLQRSRTNPIL